MCRLLGFWAKHPRTLPAVMGTAWESFADLSRRHPDGWGLVWVDAQGQMHRVKEPVAAWNSPEFFRLTHTVRARAMMLHLRWASPGLAVSPGNTHPFLSEDGAVAFMHNGGIDPLPQVWQAVPRSRDHPVEGNTDSEAYFRLWERHVSAGQDPVAAIHAAIRHYQRPPFSYTGLNAYWMRADRSYVVSEYHESAPLARDDPDYYRLYVGREPDRMVVASSGWAIPRTWRPMPNHAVMTIAGQDGEITAMTDVWSSQSGVVAGWPSHRVQPPR